MATAPADAVSLVGDFYLKRKLGVGFQKPNGWSFADVQEMGSVKRGQLLAIEDEVATGELLDSMELPFVSVSRSAKTPNSLAPSAQFYLVDDMPALHELFNLGDKLERLLVEFTGKDEPADELPRTLKKLHEDAQ